MLKQARRNVAPTHKALYITNAISPKNNFVLLNDLRKAKKDAKQLKAALDLNNINISSFASCYIYRVVKRVARLLVSLVFLLKMSFLFT
jgi:hypothetical protein